MGKLGTCFGGFSSFSRNISFVSDADKSQTSAESSRTPALRGVLGRGIAQASVDSAISYLEEASKCMERVQDFIMPKLRVKLNPNQCTYLAGVLKSAVECSKKSFSPDSSSEDQAECVQALKLLYWLATEIENLIREHCDSEETWMQAALTLASVPVRVASLGYQLKLCREFLRNNITLRAAWLTFTKLETVRKGDLDAVQSALLDEHTLLKTLESLSFKSLTRSGINRRKLITILCNRLKAIEALSTAGPQERVNLNHLIEVDGAKLERLETLGKGTTTTVYKAKWFGAVEVALKVFPLQNRQDGMFDGFSVLAQLSHPNIVSFLGYAVTKGVCSAVLELMDGDLKLLMQQKLLEGESRQGPFSIQVACDIMLQVAEGVHYMHEKLVVHGNLKPASVVFKGSKDISVDYVLVKVGNFGLPKQDDDLVTIAGVADDQDFHTQYWMAPERLQGTTGSTFESDVFSFGMLCFAILTGNGPFGGDSNYLEGMITEGIRPDLPAQCPQDLKSLIMLCWDPKPHVRPSFAKICEELWYIKCSLLQDMSWMSKPLLEEIPRQSEVARNLPESVIRDFKGEYSSLRLMRQLGKGGSDSVTVYLSEWVQPNGAKKVAQKMFIGLHFQEFENEVSILANLEHHNVVRLFCYATDWRSCSIIMEQMDADLQYWINQRRLDCRSSTGPFSKRDAIHIMLQIAQGMEYVHGKDVVHRDLKSSNILVRNGSVGEQLDVKVSDFGVSKKLKSKAQIPMDKDSFVGTYRWMAPELLTDVANMSESVDLFKCDIYSFGMVCYEIMSGKVPFHEMKNLSDVKQMVSNYGRPILPDWTPKKLRTLIEKCWHQEPSSRPSFPAILKELKHT